MKQFNFFLVLIMVSSLSIAQTIKKSIQIIDNISLRPIPCKIFVRKNNKDILVGPTDKSGFITLPCDGIDSIKVIPDDFIHYYNSKIYICSNLSNKIILSNKYQIALITKKIDSLALKNDFLTTAIYYQLLDKGYRLMDSSNTAEIYKKLTYQAIAKHYNLDKSIKIDPNSYVSKMSSELEAKIKKVQDKNGLLRVKDESGNLTIDNKTLKVIIGKERFEFAKKNIAL